MSAVVRHHAQRAATVARYAAISLRGAALRAAARLSGGLAARRRHELSQSLVLAHLLRSRKQVVGMTSFDERAYGQWYAERLYSGAGAIVELGCWLGSATVPLALGLSRNPRAAARSRPIQVYDLFRWDDGMDVFVEGTGLEGRHAPGDSFLDAYLEQLGPLRGLVEAHEADLARETWDGGPIELLVVDAMKSWALAAGILSSFFGALIPGRGLVLHQDFAHWRTPWIHLVQYRLRDYLELVYDIPRSDGAVFVLTRPLPAELLTARYDYGEFERAELEAAFEHSLALARPEKRPNIRAAKIRMLIDIGDRAAARAELDRCRSAGLSFDSDLRLVEELLRLGR